VGKSPQSVRHFGGHYVSTDDTMSVILEESPLLLESNVFGIEDVN
jgi:hypothetical protein